MSGQSQVAVCRRCGIGFLNTDSYRAYVLGWGSRVSVPQLCNQCFHREGPVPKRSGTVEWFNRRKRYGFIVDEQGERIFLHQNALYEANRSRPREGQQVLYHVDYAIKGPEAQNVELLEPKRDRHRNASQTRGEDKMGAVPKSKISKGRRNRRRAHHALKLRDLVVCPNCRGKKLPHRVCMSCGTYRGVQVLSV